MKILLAGPTLTSSIRQTFDVPLESSPPGTAATPLVPLAKALSDIGHEIIILTLDPTIESTISVCENGLTVVFCPLRGSPRFRARSRALDLFEIEIRHLVDAIVRAAPDVVHAHWTYEYAEAAVRSRLPHLVTMHDLGWQYLGQFRDLYRLSRLVMKYRTLPRVQNLTVVAPFMAPLAKWYGYFRDIDIIPNGIDLNLRREYPESRDLTRPKIVTVGNDGPIKNVTKSVEAFRIIRQVLPAAELHLFGPGLDQSFSKDEQGVFGHGNVSHDILMSFLSDQATLLVHPSILETFGMIIIEAKARGIPVVAGTNSGGTVYTGGEYGATLVDCNSSQEIAAAVVGILSDSVRYMNLANGALKDVQSRFAVSVVAREYSKVYSRITGES